MALRKNKKFIDPRYFMDEKTELTENQKQRIKTLLEQEIANGNQINEGVLQDLAKKFGVPIALVAAIASGIGAVNTSADVSPATSPDTTEMPADAGSMGPGMSATYDAETGETKVKNTMGVDTKVKKPFGPFKVSDTMDVDTKVKHKSDDSDQGEPFKLYSTSKVKK
jgi:hypothetical protein